MISWKYLSLLKDVVYDLDLDLLIDRISWYVIGYISLLGNLLKSKGTIRAGEGSIATSQRRKANISRRGTISAGEGKVREGKGV